MRPSKRFFYQHFIEDMKQTSGCQYAADISCADFKNYRYFKSENYIGVDIREDVLNHNMPSIPGRPAVITHATDIRKLNLPQKGAINFIVSSHTVSHLDPGERLAVVRLFIDHLAPGGKMILTMPFDNSYVAAVDDLLSSRFEHIKKLQFRNAWSTRYENWRATPQSEVKYRPTNSFGLKLFEQGLYLLEKIRLGQNSGTYLYYFAQNKKRSE